MQPDRFVMENKLWVITSPIGLPVYDFDFRQFFLCRTPYQIAGELPGLARVGAFDDYRVFYDDTLRDGIQLLNTPEEQELCSSLPRWYPCIEGLTPRSRWYEGIPTFEELIDHFSLPFFIKGARQTSRHQAAASVIRSREDYDCATAIFRTDSVLKWQQFVCREFVPLRRVEGDTGNKVPPSYEFRTFWHRHHLLGAGRYWYGVPEYGWTERDEALALASKVAVALNCGLLVIDLALTADDRWIVIECNDAMESGYAGVSPIGLWSRLVELTDA